MDSYQAMINERKRREMEAEMNRFVIHLLVFINVLVNLFID